MNNYFLDQNIQNAFYTLHEYWIKNYPNATLTIGKQITITDNSGTHTVIKPKKTTTRRKRIGSKIDKYLLESITAAILTPSMTIGKMIKEILPIDKNLSYGRQLELYGYLGEIIEEMKLMKKTTSEIQVEILGIICLDIPRVLTIARRAKTLIQRFGLLDTKLILPQILYTLSTKEFNKLVNFELDKTLQLEYPINSLILPELNLFGENNLITPTHNNTVLKIIDSNIEAVYGILATVKKKAKLSANFPTSAMHHLSLYNLFKIDDIQTKSKITDLLVRLNSNDIAEMTIKIRLANLQAQRWLAQSVLEHPTNEQSRLGVNFIANIMQIIEEKGIALKSSGNTYGVLESSRPPAHLIETVIALCATYTKKYRQSNSGKIPKWFKILEFTIIMDEHRNINVTQCEALKMHKIDNQIPDDLDIMQRDSIYIQIPDALLLQWRNVQEKLRLRKEIEILTDGSLVKAGSENAKRTATFVTYGIEANFGIAVNGTLSSTKTEAKAVLLALEAVLYKCKLTLNTDRSSSKLLTGTIKAVIEEKKIDLNINKVAAHTRISENEMADKLAKKTTVFDSVE
ncbi:hypothetical protein G9A89_007656 [Geosiphon pyriformis]|nr:hypothetical protein G9A89_007656 [Geosiphon pyriformis]